MSQQVCLKWNNHMNVMNEFKNFLALGIMVDVTLACDGQSLKAHKIVLSACSRFFRSLFSENPCKHPIVILKDVKYTALKGILDFMYCGEINVDQDQLSVLLKTAQTLRVKGLGEVESPNNHANYESENPCVDMFYRSGNEPENQSDNESENQSVCTVLNRTCRYTSDQNDHEDNEPEIKREVLDDEMNDNVDDQSFDQEESFQTAMPEKTLITDSLPGQSFSSHEQSSTELEEHHSDNASNVFPETSTDMSSDALVTSNKQAVSSHKKLRGKVEEENPARKSVHRSHKSKKRKIIKTSNCNSQRVINHSNSCEKISSNSIFHECQICPFKTMHSRNLRRHVESIHNKNRPFKCDQCAYAATLEEYLLRHMTAVHQSIKLYQCNLCSYKTYVNSRLKRHIGSVHKKKKNFACALCSYQTQESDGMKQHLVVCKKQIAVS